MQIVAITTEEAQRIIDSRQPVGLFYVDDGAIVGVDNSTGDAWTEEFESVAACIKWLRREES